MKVELPQAHCDWSDAEKSELELLRAAWPPPNYEMECGLTEDGDPWCVVRDSLRDATIIHLARIERRSDKGTRATLTLMSRAIELAIQ
jgi:hypothetical protein